MSSYQDLITRITDIISKSMNKDNTIKIIHFNILPEYYEEFRKLIDIENVWYELSTDINKYVNNNNQLILEANVIKNENNSFLVEKLIEILNSSYGLTPFDLVLIDGYVISKNNEKSFIDITKKLHIGPYQPIINIKDVNSRLDINRQRKLNQYNRLKGNLPNYELDNNNDMINSKFKHLILLFNSGTLEKSVLKYLSTILNDLEYITLLNDLKKYLILNEEEYNTFYSYRSGEPVIIDTIDELVLYLSNIKDLTIEMVLTFKEIYGASFVDTLILELYKKGVFEASEYDDYINQKNNEEIL